MFTTGSKLLIGSAAAAWVFAAIYGIAQEGTLGTIGLISAAVGLSLLAGINVFVRDSNVSAMDHDSFDASAAAQATARPSLWPLLVALGATTLTLGLVTYRAIFVLGLIAIAAGAIEWLIQGWSERASADRGYNAAARDMLVDPLELPVAGAIGAGVVVYAFSRVMLGLPSKTATVVAFAVLAAIVLAVAALIGLQRNISKSTLTGAFSIAAIALIAGGAFAGLNGERKTHVHETTGYLAEENECGTEETEADENASQTVASKSNVAAELTFDGDRLDVDVPGFDGDFAALTLPRSNPNNVLFRNESDHHARLVIELYPDTDDDGVPLSPERVCTALVEEGGVQLLTVEFDRPSFAIDEEYAFTVAGSEAAAEVVVP
ncbi:MAG: hypothetical protein QNJ12_15985 [Ilumatobacter sp.]|uniref:hypothetical protein n=1 Tax=Ilumatobacter sp. TaxID=1967498 RepID=UPI002620749A|nr:hypothetical protein [Ilumatobacter sp.]MDJ0770299.1 hypothetical protein [Ilumatobacter sp.]